MPLKPTLAEVKAELRIPASEDYDDDIIQGYIDGAADSLFTELHWAKPLGLRDGAVVDFYNVTLSARRFRGRAVIEMPIRGLFFPFNVRARTNTGAFGTEDLRPSNLLLSIPDKDLDTYKAGETVLIRAGAEHGFVCTTALQSNRYKSHFYPTSTWEETFEEALIDDYTLDDLNTVTFTYQWANNREHAFSPPALLLAIKKLAVDYYQHNGVGSEPMQAAIDRLINPLRDHG